MKILKQTTDEMVLKDGSVLSGLIGGIIFAGLGGFVLYLNHIDTVAILVGIIFAIAGLVQIFFATSTTITVNKGRGQLFLQKRGLIKNQLKSYAIADIDRIEMRNDFQTQHSTIQGRIYMRPVIIYQSVFVMKDGTELPLGGIKTPRQVSGIGSPSILRSGESKEVAVGQQIATFISIPFQKIGVSSAS